MSFDTLLPWMFSIGLLTVRLVVAVALSPALSGYGVPSVVRLALTMALATLTFANRSALPAAAAWAANPTLLLIPILSEILVGALLGLGVQAVFAALALAGRLMDVQVGFGIGSVFDPVTQNSSNVLGSLVSLVGVALFVSTGAHLQLAQLVSRSIDWLPLGQPPSLDDPMRPVLAAGSMFSLGLAFAAPVAVSLLLTDLAVGVASRNLPQVNVLVLSIPAKVIAAYLVLALTLTAWGSLLQQGLDHAIEVLGLG